MQCYTAVFHVVLHWILWLSCEYMYSVITACPNSSDMWLFPVDFNENCDCSFRCDWSIRNYIKQRIDFIASSKRGAREVAIGGLCFFLHILLSHSE